MVKRVITTVIAEDHPNMRKQIRALLESSPHIRVIGEAGDGSKALKLTKRLSPDILILDIEMPEINGLEVMRRLKSSNLQTRFLALSAVDDTQFVLEILANKAASYMIKDEAPQHLVFAVEKIVYDQTRWISSRVTEMINRMPSSNPMPTDTTLTPDDVWLIKCLSDADSYDDFVKKIDRSEEEVNRLLTNLYPKLGVHNFLDAVEVARKYTINWQK